MSIAYQQYFAHTICVIYGLGIALVILQPSKTHGLITTHILPIFRQYYLLLLRNIVLVALTFLCGTEVI